jgi:hypothetical protein
MTEEAKKALKKAMSERREFVAQRALWRALDDGRNKAEEGDIQEALEELKPKKRPRLSLPIHISAFLGSFMIFELITNFLACVVMNIFFMPINAEKYTAIGGLFAATISTGAALSVAFYRFILRDRL